MEDKQLETLLEEIIKTEEFKSSLTGLLAEKISDEYHYQDPEGIILKEEVRRIVKEEAKCIIEDLAKNYFELNIKDNINDTIKRLTRTEIIGLLKE